jgi:hypothetical protein
MDDFYDRMAGLYHLIFPDWDASIERQGEQLAGLIRERWGAAARTVLDVSCGIGTQAIGLTDDDLLLALRQMHACTRPGGGCLVTVRDYDREERGAGLVKHYGVREEGGTRYVVFQVWDFAGPAYDLSMYFVADDGASGEVPAHVMRTRYNAVGTGHLLGLMRAAGFAAAERLDGRFYQPILVADRGA